MNSVDWWCYGCRQQGTDPACFNGPFGYGHNYQTQCGAIKQIWQYGTVFVIAQDPDTGDCCTEVGGCETDGNCQSTCQD